MNLHKDDIVKVRRKHLYWILQGSHVLNATVDSTSANAEEVVRARVLEVRDAPRWGSIVFLAVENEKPPQDAALVALCRSCEKEY